MKIHIIFEIQEGPFGGGNQFLKALRDQFRKRNLYAEKPEEADIFLFNSFQDTGKAMEYKNKYSSKLFVHRLDGPISLYRNSKSSLLDKAIYDLNSAMADATIFQSKFSADTNKNLGIKITLLETIIFNASDENIFYPKENKDIDFENRKIKLISVSWSSNIMKGFNDYRYLDENLDFEKYDYTFIGNSPFKFKNIKMLPPKSSQEIAEILRDSDIYITASKKDPCSNSLIEALSCGLSVIALNDGGHPELVQDGGELFNAPEEIAEKISKITANYNDYRKNLPTFNLNKISEEYINFFESLLEKQKKDNYRPKKISLPQKISINLEFFISRFIR